MARSGHELSQRLRVQGRAQGGRIDAASSQGITSAGAGRRRRRRRAWASRGERPGTPVADAQRVTAGNSLMMGEPQYRARFTSLGVITPGTRAKPAPAACSRRPLSRIGETRRTIRPPAPRRERRRADRGGPQMQPGKAEINRRHWSIHSGQGKAFPHDTRRDPAAARAGGTSAPRMESLPRSTTAAEARRCNEAIS